MTIINLIVVLLFVFCSDIAHMQKLSSVGYVFFHRHGHRAPIKNIFKSPLEFKLWESMLPDSSAVQDLSVKYPIVTHESIVTQPDCQSKPFGYLTKPGMDHLKLTGRKAREMFPSLENISTIEAYSTNYRRTQVIITETFIFINNSLTTDKRSKFPHRPPSPKCASSGMI